MFEFMKFGKKDEPEATEAQSGSKPSDDENKQPPNPARRTSSEPPPVAAKKPASKPAFDDDDDDWGRPPPRKPTAKDKERYKSDFKDSGGLENQSVQELENYAVYRAEETTDSVNNCLKIAENIREDASKTLDMLHEQGEQINRTHNTAVQIDKDLSKGEKLLGNLGGMFSMPWQAKKTKKITGPVTAPDKPNKKASKEQKEKLVGKGKKTHSAPATPAPEPATAMEKIELEKAKQDDALDDLSGILGDLKGMAVDMGGELDRQNVALDHLSEDVDELNSRVKGANTRARKLLAK